MLDPHDMGARGRIGGYSRAAKYGADELTGAARSGFMARFTPTDPGLSESERQRRAECALKAYMAQLARRSAIARRKGRQNHGRAQERPADHL